MIAKPKKKYINNIYIIILLIIYTILTFLLGFKLKKNSIYLSRIFSNFISYSQHLEDLVLFSIFYDVENGFYIDVGAHDPNIISVTKAFYLRGWSGINIEPLPNEYKALHTYRKRDINLNIAIGEKEGIGTLNIDTKFKSCTSLLKRRTNDTKRYKYLNITINTMANICQKYIHKNKDIQFCKIDVEGFEKNVLLGFDFTNFRPKVFCIESIIPKDSYKLWENILLDNDYSFSYQYLANRFYIDNRIKGLRERFILADNIINNYNSKKYK